MYSFSDRWNLLKSTYLFLILEALLNNLYIFWLALDELAYWAVSTLAAMTPEDKVSVEEFVKVCKWSLFPCLYSCTGCPH